MDPLSYGAKEDQIAANERANILKYFLGLAGSDLNNRKLDSTIFGDDSNDLKLAALDQAPATYPTTQGGLAGAFGTMANSIATFGNSVRNAKTKEEMQARKDNTVNFMGDYYNQAAAQRAALDNGLITPEAYLASMQDLKGAFWGRLQNDPRSYMINTAIRGMAMHDSAFGVDDVQKGLMQSRAQATQAEMQQSMFKTMQSMPAATSSGGATLEQHAATLKALESRDSRGLYDTRTALTSIPYFSADDFDKIFSQIAADNLSEGYKNNGSDYNPDMPSLSHQAKRAFLENVYKIIDGDERLNQEAKNQFKANVTRAADIYTTKLIQHDNENSANSYLKQLTYPSISGLENARNTFQLDGYNDIQRYVNHRVNTDLHQGFDTARSKFAGIDTKLADTAGGNSYMNTLLRNAYVDYGSAKEEDKNAKMKFLVDNGIEASLIQGFVQRTASRMGLDTADSDQVGFLEHMLVNFLYNSIQHYSDKSRLDNVIGQLITNLSGDTSNYSTSLFSRDTNDLFRDNVQTQLGTADIGNMLFRDEESDLEHARAIGTFIVQNAKDARSKATTTSINASSHYKKEQGKHFSGTVTKYHNFKNQGK